MAVELNWKTIDGTPAVGIGLWILRGMLSVLFVCTGIMAGTGCGSSHVTQMDSTATPPPPVVRQTPPAVELTTTTDTLHTVPAREGTRPDSSASQSRTRYTIQIGAFKDPQNANGVQQKARQRYQLPVLNDYDTVRGFYRICIGVFDSRESAQAFSENLKKDYPGEYSDCWVAQLR